MTENIKIIPESCLASVMVSADVKEQFAIRFMCWCEENKGWIDNYSNEEKMIIFKKEVN